MEKLKFLFTFKADHRILRQILCKNKKFQINQLKICSKQQNNTRLKNIR